MSVSGLSRPQRHTARERAVQAALLGLHHAPELHYTEGPERWEGITRHDVAAHGKYPHHADCSSFATWCLWNALRLPFGLPDVVNGEQWAAGYTGTMINHGREVMHVNNVIRGDCVFYGQHDNPYHVTIVVGHNSGRPIVVSNGSEPGPFLLAYDYAGVAQIRRYI